MDERALDILVALIDLNAKSPMRAITAKELTEQSGIASLSVSSSLYQALDFLCQLELIARGIRRNRSTTWYITECGIKYYDQLLAGEEEE